MKKIYYFARDLVNAYIEDDGLTKGAALAYYTTFSLAPILIIIISTAGFFFGRDAISGEVYAQLADLLGKEAAEAVQEIVKASYLSNDSVFTTILGVGTLIFGATGAFNQLKLSLDQIWEIESKPANGVVGFLKARATSFAIVLGLGFILLVSLAINALAVGLSSAIGDYFSLVGEITLAVLSSVISIALTGGIFAIIFKELPDVTVRWREVLWGALFTAILFSIGRFGIGYYIGNSSITSGFGAAGSLVALLVWTYYSSQIVFLGAEFIWVLARNNGHPVLPSKNAVRVVRKTQRLEKAAAEREERKLAKKQRKDSKEGTTVSSKAAEAKTGKADDDMNDDDINDGDADQAPASGSDRAHDPSWPAPIDDRAAPPSARR